MADEGRAVAKFMGLDWGHMQMDLDPAMKQGIVTRKGRYWYVSPELLALWLAAEVWQTQSHRVPELLSMLPTQASRDSLLQRLSQLGALPSVRSVLEEVFDDGGPFSDLQTLDNERVSSLFLVLTKGAPPAAMSALNRIFGTAPRDTLLHFTRGRRNVIWSLEMLLQWRSTFFDAARLIRRLADAENETFANNATGVWSDIFLTVLGPTEVPPLERFILIEEALESDSGTVRILAVKALSSALRGQEFATAPTTRGDIPPPHYRPRTWEEVRHIKRRALSLLGKALVDPTADVSAEARTVFITNARSLILQGLADEVIEWFGEIGPVTEIEQRRVWESIMDALKYASQSLNESQTQRLHALSKDYYGDSLPDRIKRYTGRWSHVDWPSEGEPREARPEHIAEQLAEEALQADDELRPLLGWLASGEAEQLWPFMHRLGELDTQRRWFEDILSAGKEGKDPRLFSAYLRGRTDAGDPWPDSLLDTFSHDPHTTTVAFDATLRGPPSDHAALRLLKMADQGWIDPNAFGWLQYGG